MSALRAAKDAQAETLAPELYRLAEEWHQRAKREYNYKNFSHAKKYLSRARQFAEQAEFAALREAAVKSTQDTSETSASQAPQDPTSTVATNNGSQETNSLPSDTATPIPSPSSSVSLTPQDPAPSGATSTAENTSPVAAESPQ